ncbi:MAG: MTH1187 family thiamine-binding protein [Thermoanaerobaculia bacterium]
MIATAEIQVIPLGVGTSVRDQVKKAHEILAAAGLHAQLHAYGTNVEGDLHQIFAAIEKIHEMLHADGVPRLATAIKVGTRTDKEPSLAAKLF